MTPGLHSFPSDQYHAAPGISRSMLEWIAPPKTPAHYKAKWIDKLIADETTPAMEFGSLLHRCLLEPETVKDSHYIRPEDYDGRTKAGKEWLAEHSDKLVITAEQSRMITGMTASLMAHRFARSFIEKSDKERNAFADDNGLLLRARYDMLPTWSGANMIADLKTCEAADADSAARAVLNYGYHRQAAFYLRVARLLNLGRKNFVFIFVEKSPPYAVNVLELEPTVLEFAQSCVARDLQCVRNCMESGQWPAYPADGIDSVALPPHAMKQIEQAA